MFKSQNLQENGQKTEGRITDVKCQWWFKVNTKAFRTNCMDGAKFPHRASYVYTVDGKEYTGKTTFKWYERIPVAGETLTVFYDEQNPELHIVKK